ncbi:uncharacterized protein LOC135832617 isoform X2 [Planococcus citri]|uniref:uncharacterized protein LOC135832617 isoform X2 n=1 Tax=Planococcus citri TaxID=170843 RepID=UPI0031F85755
MKQIFSIPKHVVFLVKEVPLFYGLEKYPTLDMCIEKEILISKGIRLNVISNTSELPDDISNLVRILQDITKSKAKLTLNILIGHLGETDLRNLDAIFQSSEWKSETDIFSKCIWPFSTEPQLILSNCIYKRLTDYLMWKTPSRCVFHFHQAWNTMKFYHFLGSLILFQFHRVNRSKL